MFYVHVNEQQQTRWGAVDNVRQTADGEATHVPQRIAKTLCPPHLSKARKLDKCETYTLESTQQ